jgi:hypothetical protein
MTESQDTTTITNPKLCECGCGNPAPIAKVNRPKCGWVKGEPIRYIKGHHRTAGPVQLREPFIGPCEPGTRMIPLTRDMFAKVDERDYDELAQFNWTYGTGGGYVTRQIPCMRNGERAQKLAYMHRVIMQTPAGMVTDHINHDTLDNRRSNLRVCTRAENSRNQSKYLGAKASAYKGVKRTTGVRRESWEARVRKNYLGCYATEEEAALAYDRAAEAMYGEFACLNFPDRTDDPVALNTCPVPVCVKGRARTRSGYRGVQHFANSPNRPWCARFQVNGKYRSFGFYADPIEAARVYDKAARELYGEYAILNFPDEPAA